MKFNLIVPVVVVNVCKRKAETETSQGRRANEKISEGCVEENKNADESGELLLLQLFSEMYLEPCQISMIELFCENK